MARRSMRTRPKNLEVENEMVQPPEREGKPPRPATEPPRAPRPKATGRG